MSSQQSFHGTVAVWLLLIEDGIARRPRAPRWQVRPVLSEFCAP